jgi:23S rRNA pseudouridine2605 synthase
LRNGITVEGVNYDAIEAVIDSETDSNVWLTMTLHEGKNREIRRVLEFLGLQVNRLIRVSYGPFELADLQTGHVREVPRGELKDFIADADSVL